MEPTTVEKARRGDREAQAELLAELQDPWYRLSLSLLAGSESARDATQESALRFLRELPKFRGQSSIRTWAMGIVINVAREMRRKNRPFKDIDPELSQQETAGLKPALPGADEVAGQAEERRALNEALAALPERQREAIVLRFFEELSVDETAQVMQCAPGTIKATVHQALRTLKTKLKQLI